MEAKWAFNARPKRVEFRILTVISHMTEVGLTILSLTLATVQSSYIL